MPRRAHFLGKTFGSCSLYKDLPCSLPSESAYLEWRESGDSSSSRSQAPALLNLAGNSHPRGKSSVPTDCLSLSACVAFHSKASMLAHWPWLNPSEHWPRVVPRAVSSSHRTVHCILSGRAMATFLQAQEKVGLGWCCLLLLASLLPVPCML